MTPSGGMKACDRRSHLEDALGHAKMKAAVDPFLETRPILKSTLAEL